MILLILGVLIWSLVHLVPSAFPGLKKWVLSSMGENGYKGLFSLFVLGSVVLIVFGWKNTSPQPLFYLGSAVRHIGSLFMLFSVYCLVVSQTGGRLKGYVRHPMLVGVIIWALAHTLMNGDLRSAILFVGMGIWAILEIVLINRRDGQPVKMKPPTIGNELLAILITGVVTIALVWAHPYITGVALHS